MKCKNRSVLAIFVLSIILLAIDYHSRKTSSLNNLAEDWNRNTADVQRDKTTIKDFSSKSGSTSITFL